MTIKILLWLLFSTIILLSFLVCYSVRPYHKDSVGSAKWPSVQWEGAGVPGEDASACPGGVGSFLGQLGCVTEVIEAALGDVLDIAGRWLLYRRLGLGGSEGQGVFRGTVQKAPRLRKHHFPNSKNQGFGGAGHVFWSKSEGNWATVKFYVLC